MVAQPERSLPAAVQQARLAPGALTPGQVIELQQRQGNQAVQRLLAVQRESRKGGKAPAPPAGGSPGPNTMSRGDFDLVMQQRFGVAEVKTGEYVDQVADLSQSGRVQVQLPENRWQRWDPGPASPIYNYIVEGFNDFANRIGGTPAVQKVTFFKTQYDVDRATGATTPRPDVGAEFGHGELLVFQRAVQGPRPLPIGQSTASGQYERPRGGEMRTPGSEPGAPLGLPTREQSVKRTITHELSHGLIEVAFSLDAAILTKYQKAVGWSSERLSKLYDITVPAVQQAIEQGQTPEAQYEITPDNWNHPRWGEQPVSLYMVAGGPSEDFPEAVMAYINAPQVLLERSPRRYHFLKAHMEKWRRHLRL